MNEQAIRFRVGIFVLAALILMAVLITLFGGFPNYFRPSTTYTIVFSNAQGVGPGTPVKRSGVKIGEVRKVSLDNDSGKVHVLIQVDDGFTIRTSDRPTLLQTLLGGDASIAFLPPEKKGADTSLVEPGTELTGYTQADAGTLLERTTEVVPTAEQTLNEIKRAAQAMEKVFLKIDKLTPGVEKALQNLEKLGPSADETLQEFRKVGKSVNEILPEMKKTFDKLGPNMDATLDEIRKFAKSANELMPELKKTNDQVLKTFPDVRKTLDEMQVTARNWSKLGERLDVLVQTNEDKLIKTLDRVQETIKRVGDLFSDENQKSVREILKNTRITSERFDGIARGADDFLKEARTTLKKMNESFTRIDDVLVNIQKVTKPFADRGESIAKSLDEGADRVNKTMGELHEILQMVGRGEGTVQKLLTDPSLYNNLNEASCGVNRIMPHVDRILRDMEIFSDRLARHPELLGVRGAIAPSNGLKGAPSQYNVFPFHP